MNTAMQIVNEFEEHSNDNVSQETDENKFWLKKTNAKNPTLYSVLPDSLGFTNYLKSIGIAFEKKSREMVYFKDGIVTVIDMFDLKHIVMGSISKFPEVMPDGVTKIEIKKMVAANDSRLFKAKGIVDLVGYKDFDWISSTKKEAFFFYRNGVVEVSKSEIILKPYSEIQGFIWSTEVVDRDFTLVETKDSQWRDFIRKAAGNTPTLIANMMRGIGYILHSYKDPSRPYLTILGEAVVDSSNGGGSGKSLTGIGISKIVPTVFKDMKQFSANGAFEFSMVNQDSKVFILSDLKENFGHEILHNMISEGFQVNKKGKPIETFDFEDSPKIVATTNYSLDNSTNHSSRRQRLIEFSDHFNATNTPENVYKGLFFSDWDSSQWQMFDTFQMQCVLRYLKEGFPKVEESDTSKRKRILGKKGMLALMDWLNDYEHEGFKAFKEIYNEYTSSAFVEKDEKLARNEFTRCLIEAVGVSGTKKMDIAENGRVKSFKIWQE